MARKSRYADTQAFAPDSRGNSTFAGVRPREITPATGMIEHSVTAGERLDQLATHYFDNNRLWWRIGDANWTILFSADLLLDLGNTTAEAADPLNRQDMIGRAILIPRAKE